PRGGATPRSRAAPRRTAATAPTRRAAGRAFLRMLPDRPDAERHRLAQRRVCLVARARRAGLRRQQLDLVVADAVVRGAILRGPRRGGTRHRLPRATAADPRAGNGMVHPGIAARRRWRTDR